MSLQVSILPALQDNFIYVLCKGSDCAVIDPSEAEPVEAFLRENNLQLKSIFCTHHHWDHIGGIPKLRAQFNCEVLCSNYDFPRIAGATRVFDDREMTLGEPMEVLPTPGHTFGQVALYLPNSGILFTGDTLFSAGCGRLMEGTPEQMFTSLARLKQLPADTKIYFGHEYTLRNLEFVSSNHAASDTEVSAYRKTSEEKLAVGQPTTPTTLKTELKVNPFLIAKDIAEFTKWRELRNHF